MRQVAALFGRGSFSNRFERFQGFSSLRLCRRCYVTLQPSMIEIGDATGKLKLAFTFILISFPLKERLASAHPETREFPPHLTGEG